MLSLAWCLCLGPAMHYWVGQGNGRLSICLSCLLEMQSMIYPQAIPELKPLNPNKPMIQFNHETMIKFSDHFQTITNMKTWHVNWLNSQHHPWKVHLQLSYKVLGCQRFKEPVSYVSTWSVSFCVLRFSPSNQRSWYFSRFSPRLRCIVEGFPSLPKTLCGAWLKCPFHSPAYLQLCSGQKIIGFTQESTFPTVGRKVKVLEFTVSVIIGTTQSCRPRLI